MWYEQLVENWQGVVISALAIYEFGKGIKSLLPSFNLRKVFEKGNAMTLQDVRSGVNEMITSGELIYKEAQSLVKELHIEREINKSKDEQLGNLIQINTLLISALNVPKEMRVNVYNVLKGIDGVNSVLVETLKQSIDIQGQEESKIVEEDTQIDKELSEV